MAQTRGEEAAATLPRRFCRNMNAYRILNQAGDDGSLGVGFLCHKSGGGYRGVFPKYGALLLLRGRGEYRDDKGNRAQLTPGCFIQRLPDRWHETPVAPDGKWVECYLTLGLPLYRALAQMKVIDPARPVIRPGIDLPLVERFYQLMQRLAAAPDSGLPLLVPALIELAALLFRRDAEREEGGAEYGAALALAERELAEAPERARPLTEIFSGLPVSYERLRKLFKERTGLAPGEYRIRRRIEKAVEMLQAGELRLYQIAHALGYPDAYAFSKQFKTVTGLSPRAYRTAIRGSGR